nr:peptidoglycan bridge formation glycyltransferase FemA/FemB family protein [uncultured Desulfobacter sp.]
MSDLFQVKEISTKEWDEYWPRCCQATLLQSRQYVSAKHNAEGWKGVGFLISDENRNAVCIAHVLTKGLPWLGSIARLNRGPLLLDGVNTKKSDAIKLASLNALLNEAQKRRWWVFQIAPELKAERKVCQHLQHMGLRLQKGTGWASGLMSLSPDEQDLLMTLNGKWRNCLRKGERLGVQVTRHEGHNAELSLLIQNYSELQRNKGFEGISTALLSNIAAQTGIGWQFNIFIARDENASNETDPIGMLVSIRHGDTTTYLIGSTNDQGRRMQANSVLLWQAILHAKRTRCAWFDIGGLSDLTPKGIARFKKGLNSQPYVLAGEWRWFYWSNLVRKRFPGKSNETSMNLL